MVVTGNMYRKYGTGGRENKICPQFSISSERHASALGFSLIKQAQCLMIPTHMIYQPNAARLSQNHAKKAV